MSDVSLKDAKALAVELVDICLKQHEQIKGEISQPTKLSAIFAQHRINGLGARSGTGSYVKLVAYEKNSSNTIVMSISEGQAEELMNQLQGVLELPKGGE